MNRRSFLRNLLLAPAVVAVDPDLLTWKPGARLISIPKQFGMSNMGYVWREEGHVFYTLMREVHEIEIRMLQNMREHTGQWGRARILDIEKPGIHLYPKQSIMTEYSVKVIS